jgi:pimeloyl-ACP methyl ester carboxylesterase
VLVPGLGSGARLFGTLPRRFARAGFTCCAVDPGRPAAVRQPAGRHLRLRAGGPRRARGRSHAAAPVALVGTSLGGKVCLAAAATNSPHAAALVMLCSSALQTPRSRRVYRWFELLCSEVDGRWLGDLTAPVPVRRDVPEPEVRRFVDDIVRSTKPSEAGRLFMKAQAQALQAFDGSELAPLVKWPTLCLAGAEDTLTLPREVLATASADPGRRTRVLRQRGPQPAARERGGVRPRARVLAPLRFGLSGLSPRSYR